MYFSVLLFLVSTCFCFSQNLVQNHDFSQIQSSVTIRAGISSFNHWNINYALNGDFNWLAGGANDTCCLNVLCTVQACPGYHYFTSDNQWNYQLPLPLEGKGFGSIYYYALASSLIPSAEVISLVRNELKGVLAKDTLYCSEVHVRFLSGKVQGVRSNFTHDGFGIYLSSQDSLPSARPWKDGIVPQVAGFGYLTNTNNWQKQKGSFVAQGSEQYLFLGNFNPYGSPPQFIPGSPPSNDTLGILLFDAVYVYNCRDTLFSVLQQDTTVCFGQTVVLTPSVNGFKLQDSITTYTWQPPSGNPVASTNNAFTATEPGLYTVEVIINKRFTSATSFTVNWLPEAPDSNFFADSLALCPGQPQLLTLPKIAGATYLWSNGDTTNYSTIGLPGNYTVQITTPCWVHTEQFVAYQTNCGTRIFIPNAFTPNGDGVNDYFEVFGPLQPFTLIVTNRWGQIVYKSEDYQNNWDGTYLGELLPTDVYSYRVIYAKLEGGPKNYELFGTVSILK